MAQQRGMAFGPQILFTYGPWGWLDYQYFVDQFQLLAQVVFNGATSAAFVVTTYLLLRSRLQPWPVAMLVLIPFVVASALFTPDERLTATAVVLALWLIAGPVRSRALAGVALLGVLAGGLPLVKFSALAFMVPLLGLVVLAHWRRPIVWGVALTSAVLGLLGGWLLAGQSWADLFEWLQGSMALAASYSEAMALYTVTIWDAILFGLIIVLVLVFLVARTRQMGLARLQQVCLIGVGLLVAYYGVRLGFVRYQAARLPLPFTMLASVAVFAIPTTTVHRATKVFGVVIAAAVVVVGVGHAAMWQPAPGPQATPTQLPDAIGLVTSDAAFATEQFQARLTNMEVYGFDEPFVAQLRSGAVQVDPWETSIAWTYDIPWNPVPIFQLYAAYAPELDRINTESLMDAGDPRQVLVQSGAALPGQNPLWTSPAYQVALVCNFGVRSDVGPWAILARGAARCGPPIAAGSVQVAAGESVALPRASSGELVLMSFEPEDAVRSKVAAMILRPEAPLELTVGGATYTIATGLASEPLIADCSALSPNEGMWTAVCQTNPRTVSSNQAGTVHFSRVPVAAQSG